MGRVIYYISKTGENPVNKFLDSLQKSQKAKVFRVFQNIEIYGLSSILPHVKKLIGAPLWEIRIVGKDNIRVLYVTIDREDVFVLHAFQKKTQKTERKEILTALKRLSEKK